MKVIRTREGIYSFIKKRGLYIRINPWSGEMVKYTAKRIRVFPDSGLVYVMAPKAAENDPPLYILDIDHYGENWACTVGEFKI